MVLLIVHAIRVRYISVSFREILIWNMAKIEHVISYRVPIVPIEIEISCLKGICIVHT